MLDFWGVNRKIKNHLDEGINGAEGIYIPIGSMGSACMKHIQLAPEHDQVWMVEDFDQGNQCTGNFGELHSVDFYGKM